MVCVCVLLFAAAPAIVLTYHSRLTLRPLHHDFPLVPWIACQQVLDLGITRLLVHRLVRLFPSMCADHLPICGTFIASYEEVNRRLEYLGRRCRASRVGVRCVPLWPLRVIACVRAGWLTARPGVGGQCFHLVRALKGVQAT